MTLPLQFPKLPTPYRLDAFDLFLQKCYGFLCFRNLHLRCIYLLVVVIDLHQVFFFLVHVLRLVLRQLVDLIFYFLKLPIKFKQFGLHCLYLNALNGDLTIYSWEQFYFGHQSVAHIF